MIENKYKVSKKQWKKWDTNQKRMFNNLFWSMIEDDQLYKHPEALAIPNKHWTTTAWNAAFMAAEMMNE